MLSFFFFENYNCFFGSLQMFLLFDDFGKLEKLEFVGRNTLEWH